MGKPTGFMEHDRELPEKRPVEERVGDFREIYLPFPKQTLRDQAARCMDCGVPTCHAGCPLGNRIPDWNDEVYHQRWQAAYRQLNATNNFPEFTGRLGGGLRPLHQRTGGETIEQTEKTIAEHAFDQGRGHHFQNRGPHRCRSLRQIPICRRRHVVICTECLRRR